MTDKFKAKKKTLSCEQLLLASKEKVFPLLCPTKEYDWIAPWTCELIYSKSGYAELDCVFTTNFTDDVKETWIVDKYEKNRLIQFVRFSESRVIRYCIELIDNNNETTNAIWTQTGKTGQTDHQKPEKSDHSFRSKLTTSSGPS